MAFTRPTSLQVLHATSGSFTARLSMSTSGRPVTIAPPALLDRLSGARDSVSAVPDMEDLGFSPNSLAPIDDPHTHSVDRVVIFHLAACLVLFDHTFGVGSADGPPSSLVGLLKSFCQLAATVEPGADVPCVSFEPPLKGSRASDMYVPRFRPTNKASKQKTSLSRAFDQPTLELTMARAAENANVVVATFFSPLHADKSCVREFSAQLASEFVLVNEGALGSEDMQATFRRYLENPDDERDHGAAMRPFAEFGDSAEKTRERLVPRLPRLVSHRSSASHGGSGLMSPVGAGRSRPAQTQTR